MIIDTHTHFYNPERPRGVPWPPKDNKLLHRPVLPAHYQAMAEPEGITGTVVVEASAWFEDNQWILDLAADNPVIVGFVGHVNPDQPDFKAQLAQLAPHPLFLGIRCGGQYFENVDSGNFMRDMETLTRYDLELDVLLREPHFPRLYAVAERLPDLRIVVNHTGHMPVDGNPIPTVWHDHYAKMASYPNIYLKVSAVMEQSTVEPAPTDLDFYRPGLDAMWHAFGQNRVIYGSNWPVCERAGTFAQSLNIVKAYWAEKGSAAAEKYFWQNAKAVYKWV